MERRKFLIKSGIGLGVIIGIGLIGHNSFKRFLAKEIDENTLGFSNEVSCHVWFQLNEIGQLVLYSPKVEMGQGIFTALAQIAAEELEIDWEDIKVVHSTTNIGPVDALATGGSLSVSGLWLPIRELAAQMREIIKLNAAQLLKVAPSAISFKKGAIVSGSKEMSFIELSKTMATWQLNVDTPTLKANSNFKIIGKAKPRVDLIPKIKGEPIFGIDSSFKNMVYASILREPYFGAKLKSVNFEDTLKAKGVIDIYNKDGLIAVIAKSKFHADKGKSLIKATWEHEGKLLQQEYIQAIIKVGNGKVNSIQKEGQNIGSLIDKNVIERSYSSPMAVHAHLEPNGSVAFYESGKITIKMSTQVASFTQKLVAQALAMKEENVVIESKFLGGGFGRRLDTTHAVEAALISKKISKPVSVFYERNEEFQNGFLRPPTHHVLKATLNKKGFVEAMEHHTASANVAFDSPMFPVYLKPLNHAMGQAIFGADFGSWRGGMIQYKKIKGYETIAYHNKLPFNTSWWRGLGLLANTFAIESFIDELANDAKIDPIQFRINHLDENDERNLSIINVLKAVQKMSNWPIASQPNRVLGVACSIDVNTPVAQVAEVEIVDGQIKVHKVWCAIDPGIIINPDGVKAQVEGAINMGLGASLFEEIEIKDGKVTPNSFGFYKMTTIHHSPQIETEILSTGDKPRGVGEPPIGPIAAAIANAIFALTQKRVRNIPLQKHFEMVIKL